MGSPPLQNRLIVKLAFEIGDSHQYHFEKRAVFSGGGVRAMGTNETNMYR